MAMTFDEQDLKEATNKSQVDNKFSGSVFCGFPDSKDITRLKQNYL